MEELGGFIGHFTIKNDDGLDLFRIYFHENGISFDNKFLKGIISNEKAHKEYKEINDKWISGFLTKEEVVELIMIMLENNQEYLSKFFIDEFDNDIYPIYYSQPKQFDLKESSSDNEIYFNHLKENGKLNKITRKKFESYIKDERIGDYYVENLEKSKSQSTKFYTYKSKENKSCFIMVMNNKIKIGFAEK